MKAEDRAYLRSLTSHTWPEKAGRLIGELLDETEPQLHYGWRVSDGSPEAHYLDDQLQPVCGPHSGHRWRVVTNAPVCTDCRSIVESGVLT